MPININPTAKKFGELLGNIHDLIEKYLGNKSSRAEIRTKINDTLEDLSRLIRDNEDFFVNLFSEIREALSEISLDTASQSIMNSAAIEIGILKDAGFSAPSREKIIKFYRNHRKLANGEQASGVFGDISNFSQAVNLYVVSELNRIDAAVNMPKRSKKKTKKVSVKRAFAMLAGVVQAAFNIYAPQEIRQDSFSDASVKINFSNNE